MKILVIEDSAEDQLLYAELLSRWPEYDIELIHRANGREGTAALAVDAFDCILLDYRLPDVDGLTLLERLSRAGSFDTPVVMLTGQGDEAVAVRALRAGAADYIVKAHLTRESLLRAVVNAIAHQRTARENRALTEELRDSEERLRVATGASRVGIWEMARDARFSWRNREHDVIFDHAPPHGTLTLADLLDRVLAEDRARVTEAFARAMAEVEPLDIEFQVERPDQTVRWVWMRGGLGRGGDGRVRLAGTSVDVTERKLRERDLRDARNAAVAANASKTMFLANVSHEIRTPLNAILGFTDLIARDDTRAADRRRFAETVQRNGRMLMQIIDDILDLSKIEAGKMEICAEPTALRALIEDVSLLYAPAARAKGLTLNFEVAGDLPSHVSTDQNRLRQILANVVSNALKFTPRGRIDIRAREVEATPGGARWLSLAVSDTGIGIPEDAQSRLFQPFTQADGTMNRRFGGTGLGLMLSRRLAKLLGGAFFLTRSRPGEGSAFELRIPLVEASPRPAPEAPAAPALRDGGALRDVRVLLVDDSEDSRYLARLYLERDQAVVTEATGGAEALALVARDAFDVIVTDVQMPDMNGHELTRRLRRDGVAAPIIGLTAHAMTEDRAAAIRSGMNEHVGKPLRAHDLIEAVLRELRPSS